VAVGSVSASTCTKPDLDLFSPTGSGYACVQSRLGPAFNNASVQSIFSNLPDSLLNTTSAQSQIVSQIYVPLLNGIVNGTYSAVTTTNLPACTGWTVTTQLSDFYSTPGAIETLCGTGWATGTGFVDNNVLIQNGMLLQNIAKLATEIFLFNILKVAIPIISPCFPKECKGLTLAICNSNGTIPTGNPNAATSLFVQLSSQLSGSALLAAAQLSDLLTATATPHSFLDVEQQALKKIGFVPGYPATINCTTILSTATFAPGSGVSSLAAGSMSMAAIALGSALLF